MYIYLCSSYVTTTSSVQMIKIVRVEYVCMIYTDFLKQTEIVCADNNHFVCAEDTHRM